MAQRQAGVDRHVRELVCAYARLKADGGEVPAFFSDNPDMEQAMQHPEVRMVFRRDETTDIRFLDFLVRYSETMKHQNLPPIFDTQHLADYLFISIKQLVHLSYNQTDYYKRFMVPKKNGGSRSIAAPKYALKCIHRRILGTILGNVDTGEAATAFVRNTSIRDNAERHTGKNMVIRMDLENFFPTITFKQTRKQFERMGYPYSVAQALANICTLNGRLPQGAPTSPAISNLVCRKMDRRFGKLADKMEFTYSRYADDLIFSSNDRKLPKLIPLFREIVQTEGFAVNEDKLAVMKKDNRQMVTGLVVNEKPNVPKEQLRQLRAAAHRYQPTGGKPVELPTRKKDADPANVLQGRISFVNMVDPGKADQLRKIRES